MCELVKLQSSCKKLKLLGELMDRSGDYVLTVLPVILSLLQHGLGKRVHILTHALCPEPEVKLQKLSLYANISVKIDFTLIYSLEILL